MGSNLAARRAGKTPKITPTKHEIAIAIKAAQSGRKIGNLVINATTQTKTNAKNRPKIPPKSVSKVASNKN